MRRKVWFLFALISVIVVIAIRPIMLIAYEEFYVKPAFSKYPEALRPWMDPHLFHQTWYGKVPFIIYTLIGSLWIGVALLKLMYWRKWRIRNRKVQSQTSPTDDTSIGSNRTQRFFYT